MIKSKAKDLSKCDDFIASKGWLDKFKVRYNLDIVKESGGIGMSSCGVNTRTYNQNSTFSMNTSLDRDDDYSYEMSKSDYDS